MLIQLIMTTDLCTFLEYKRRFPQDIEAKEYWKIFNARTFNEKIYLCFNYCRSCNINIHNLKNEEGEDLRLKFVMRQTSSKPTIDRVVITFKLCHFCMEQNLCEQRNYGYISKYPNPTINDLFFLNKNVFKTLWWEHLTSDFEQEKFNKSNENIVKQVMLTEIKESENEILKKAKYNKQIYSLSEYLKIFPENDKAIHYWKVFIGREYAGNAFYVLIFARIVIVNSSLPKIILFSK